MICAGGARAAIGVGAAAGTRRGAARFGTAASMVLRHKHIADTI